MVGHLSKKLAVEIDLLHEAEHGLLFLELWVEPVHIVHIVHFILVALVHALKVTLVASGLAVGLASLHGFVEVHVVVFDGVEPVAQH